MKDYDVLLLGEVLVDFVPEENCVPGRFRACIGGAPGNVACGLSKLGAKAALLARVGQDALGRGVIQTLEECGVDTEYIQVDKKRFTTVTIVMPKSEDMLRYAIYRNGSADGALEYDEIPEELFRHGRILHYGTLSAAEKKSGQATARAILAARQNGMITSLDVNLRPNSWACAEDMINESKRLMEVSQIVKMTRQEAEILGIEPEKMARESKKTVIVTDGGNPAFIYAGDIRVSKAPEKIGTVDVTGGGDSFMSAFLYYYVKHKQDMPEQKFYEEAIDFAVCASSICVQRYGAIESLPFLEEIQQRRQRI